MGVRCDVIVEELQGYGRPLQLHFHQINRKVGDVDRALVVIFISQGSAFFMIITACQFAPLLSNFPSLLQLVNTITLDFQILQMDTLQIIDQLSTDVFPDREDLMGDSSRL